MQRLISFLFVLFCFASITFPGIVEVPGDQPTIQAGIDTAVDGDTVLVAEDTYYENINFKGKAITVASHFLIDGDTSHISATIIDGSQPSNSDSGSVVTLSSGEDTTSVLCGFTITGGTGTFVPANDQNPPFNLRVGGGIFIDNNSGARIKHNIIENNQITTNYYAGGGGIRAGSAADNSFIIIEDNIIRNNDISGEISFTSGGGISMSVDGRIENNVIENNIIRSINGDVVGGGVRLWIINTSSDTVVCHVRNNIISKNKAISTNGSAHAGGFNSSGIAIIMSGNTLAYNTVESDVESWGAAMHIGTLNFGISKLEQNYFKGNYGIGSGTFYAGALYIAFSQPIIQNNIFEDNAATLGGAIFMNANEKSYLINNTIVGNAASTAGGAIYSYNSELVVLNSILWDNEALIGGSQIYRTGGNEFIAYCDIQGGWAGEGNINYDPMFADSLFHLSDSSRCIGGGRASFEIAGIEYNAPEFDFEGNIRPNPANSNPDIGAMENARAYPLLPHIQIPDDYLTIQEGINAANDGDTILVAEGTYFENINFIGKAITVASNFLLDQDTSHISKTIINGSQPSQPDSGSVVYFISDEDTTSILMGFTITGGTGTYLTVNIPPNPIFNVRTGGGIFIHGSNGASILWNIIENNSIVSDQLATGGGIHALKPDDVGITIIENNIIRNNNITGEFIYVGGGAIFMGGNGRINNNTIVDNLSHSVNNDAIGGGIRFLNTEAETGPKFCLLENNIIQGNQAISEHRNSFGGGLVSSGIRLTLRNNQIISNSAKGHFDYSGGGGVYIGYLINGKHLIERNLFKGNELDGAYYGGGLALYNSEPLVKNNIFQNNSSRYGGGIFLDNGSNPEIYNNVIFENSALSSGGGIFSRNSNLIVMNTILWENSASSGNQIFRTGGSELITYSDIQGGWAGEGNIELDPLFRDTPDGDFHLMSTDCGNAFNSPCIDAGDPSYIDTLFGCEWGLGTERSDMGAYSLADILDDVEETAGLPTKFNLSQNYPNPFNPTTTIKYSIPHSVGNENFRSVQLKIYDILGREVAVLVNEKQKPGSYQVVWDAGDLSSGVYFYQLQAGQFVQTRKLLLLK